MLPHTARRDFAEVIKGKDLNIGRLSKIFGWSNVTIRLFASGRGRQERKSEVMMGKGLDVLIILKMKQGDLNGLSVCISSKFMLKP